ncbi:ORF70 [Ictalurid herpesvirus 1]|uniref:Uncharacterized protein ORF70 n=1 Tax=Ictalurid herpesvirus 1 (strain Auburn) TaxID=766178 RepID=VG70_ICHVA|nr:ORF70 [Ictalurid herpesvirus 1]Q00110.1 RecName: Full=Uncharacterized protein ORF70 [Ictalurid herpesvirus 1 (strain Auburn)]AAA88173.1 ORF70 [Ictalurid herpesvirus 1]
MDGYFKNITCEHEIICNDIRRAILDSAVEAEYSDYRLKSTMITFYSYYQHYLAIDPHCNTDVLNQTLGSNPVKLLLLTKLPCDDEMYDYISLTLGIPPHITGIWIRSWTPKTVYAAVCATEMCLAHMAPLKRIMEENPELFFEFYCVYNRIWKMNKFGEQTEQCCRGGRIMYNILLQCAQHGDPESIFYGLRGVIAFVRSTLGVHSRQLPVDIPNIDMSLLFKHFCV